MFVIHFVRVKLHAFTQGSQVSHVSCKTEGKATERLTIFMAEGVKLGEASVKPQGSHGDAMNQTLTHW